MGMSRTMHGNKKQRYEHKEMVIFFPLGEKEIKATL